MYFLCKNKYRLEVRWGSIEYKSDRLAVLNDCYLMGPALSIATKIQAPDLIDLDLTPQVISVLSNYYIVRLSWDSVEYAEDKVFLRGARISNDYLKDLHRIKDEDYIMINTEKHEEHTHAFNLVYDSKLMRADGDPYTYE